MGKEAPQLDTNQVRAKQNDWRELLIYPEVLLFVLVVAAVQYSANNFMESRARYILLLVGTCYGSWRGGKKTGIFALAMSGLIGAFFLTHQQFSLEIQNVQDSISLTLYFLVGGVIILFGESLRKERQRVLERERELLQVQTELASTNERLNQLLELRQRELSEIKRFVADEDIHP